MRKSLLLSLLISCFYQAHAQENPRLIEEINTSGASSNPQDITFFNGDAYFIADDGIHGQELWKSNGTEEGTVLVKDINPGLHHGFSEDTYDTRTDLIAINGTLYLVASDGEHGLELWKSDGTEAGTVLVKDINNGSGGSEIDEMMFYEDALYFSAHAGDYSYELWKSDGTEAGTIMVEGATATTIGCASPQNLTEVNGTLYFRASDQLDYNTKLWKYDGTTPEVVYDINPGKLTAVGTTLFFVGDDNTHGPELWKSDGTEVGTALVKDIYQGSFTWLTPDQLTNVDGTLFFTHQDSDDNLELWKSDGTETGTVLVKDIYPGDNGSSPYYLTPVGNQVFFVATDETHGVELWKSDGTEAGTELVQNIDLNDSDDYSGSYPENLLAIGSTLYFTAASTEHSSLWKSDGTEAGTVQIKSIYQGNDYPTYSDFSDIDGALFFTADDGIHGTELWKSDGTEAGTALAKDVNTNGVDSDPQNFVISGNQLFFTLGSSVLSPLGKTDGMSASMYSEDISVYIKDHSPTMVNIGPSVYITGKSNNSSGIELYKASSTGQDFTLLKDINAGSNGSFATGLFDFQGTLFFSADNGTDGHELWKSDGTEAGTAMVKDISTSTSSTQFHSFTAVESTLFFVADDNTHGLELWKTDGTEAGTVMVKDIDESTGFFPGSSAPLYLVNFQNKLYFRADDGTGSELWKSDGTEAGTIKIIDLYDGYPGGNPADLVVAGNSLYFSAFDEIHGRELWKTDGTDAGTVMVKEIQIGTDFNFGPEKLFDADGTLYFVVDDGVHGKELWKSDGSEAGTTLVKDINPNGDSNADDFLYAQDLLYFTADDGTHGKELWVTDGTENGTKMIADIYPGAYSSAPANKILLNNQLIFSATTTLGSELWVYDLPNEAPVSEDHSISVAEDSVWHFTKADFAFIDADANTLVSVKINQSTTVGSLFLDTNANDQLDENEAAITDNIEVLAEQLAQLTFVPELNGYGDQYDSFTFQVSDGKDYSDTHTLIINVTPVADAPNVTEATAVYQQFNSEGLVITPNAADGEEVKYFAITGIQHGTVYLHNETTAVPDSTFISVSEASKGLRFMGDIVGQGSFLVQACMDTTQMNWEADQTQAFITITKASQTIAFANMAADATVGDSILLTAAATSDLPVTYTVSGSAVLRENMLIFKEAGEITITASQAGNAFYHPATDVSLIITAREEEVEEENTVTSIAPPQEEDARVFPNPTLGTLQIEVNNEWVGGIVHLTDIIGRSVYHQTISSDQTILLDIYHEKPGFYIAILKKGDKRKTFKILKK
uniref:T9SS type A sorting domain-containing protein n=1 Tax=Roseihalotalea indica TaxID=2867963 RepID=A0AA49GPJ3_9BACT|nr:T9SS type A sorting domain-containing protein [Tunicatimonas sp. TK19036]